MKLILEITIVNNQIYQLKQTLEIEKSKAFNFNFKDQFLLAQLKNIRRTNFLIHKK